MGVSNNSKSMKDDTGHFKFALPGNYQIFKLNFSHGRPELVNLHFNKLFLNKCV